MKRLCTFLLACALTASLQAQTTADEVISNIIRAQGGRELEVLMEQDDVGRTPQFAEVVLSRELPAGSIVEARITGRHGNRLTAELAQPPARAQALPTRSSSEVVAP